MSSWAVPVSLSNSTIPMGYYVYHSTIKQINMISDKVVLVIYILVLLLSIIQTFWKIKSIDRILAFINKAYSDGKFQLNQVCLCGQHIISCYRYDQRYSHIPHPNRSILFIISTHIQVLILIAMQTLFVRESVFINDCESFHYPYQVLECEGQRDPCEYNYTQNTPKCTYYHLEMTNFITMVTSIITWHYALRYLIVKLARIVRWIIFRDDDQPRKCCCCCRSTPRMLRYVMRFQYLFLWIYLFFLIFIGFMWNISLFDTSLQLLGSAWAPIIIASDRLCTLSMALSPEFIQNWLNATSSGKSLLDWNSEELLFVNVEPLIHLTKKKTTEISTSDNNSNLSFRRIVY